MFLDKYNPDNPVFSTTMFNKSWKPIIDIGFNYMYGFMDFW